MSGPPRKEYHLGHRAKAKDQSHNARKYIPEGGPVSRARSRRKDIPAIPQANPDWFPQTRSWYNSLLISGQSELWEASDYATAVCAAQAYDIFLRTRNASILTSFVRLSEQLGCTMVDRQRARIELSEPERSDADEDHADNVVHGWQERLNARKGQD